MVLDFLLSPYAVLTLLLGMGLFLTMSMIPAVTNVGRTLCNIHLWLAMWVVKRAAIVVSEHGELLFKRMKFDDLGVERIAFGSETKEFEDSAQCLHHWMGFPFALADEASGLLLDPRYAYAGDQKHTTEEVGEFSARATDSDNESYGVDGWQLGVFEVPKKYELVDLTKIRKLLRGGERAEYPGRVEEFYKKSQIHHKSKMAWVRLALPVIAFIGVFVAMYWVSDQMSQSGRSTTISFGALLWLLIASPTVPDWVTKKRVIATILAILGALPFLLVLVLGGPVLFVLVSIVFAIGFFLIPIFTALGSLSARLSQTIVRLYLKFGFFGYNRPVWVWKSSGYELRDYSTLEGVGEVHWYSLAGSTVGFTFEPEEETFKNAVVENSELENLQEVDTGVSDGNIPSGYVRAPQMQRGTFGAFVPKRIKDNKIYVNTGIILNRFADAARGDRSMRKLTKAKEKYGAGTSSISDEALLKYTMVSLVAAVILGTVVFFA